MEKVLLVLSLICFIIFPSYSQINLWEDVNISDIEARRDDVRYTKPTKFGLYKLNTEALRTALIASPHENETTVRNSILKIDFPMPDGSFRSFSMVEVEMIEPRLARKFPLIKTYIGFNEEHGSKIYCNLTKEQFFGSIREKGKTYYIDPYFKHGSKHYISYYIKFDQVNHSNFKCGQHELVDGNVVEVDNEIQLDELEQESNVVKRGEAIVLKTFRIAITAETGFTMFYGGTTQGALDGIMTILTRLNGIFERDAAVRMILIGNNDKIVFNDFATDPFRNIVNGSSNVLVEMAQQNQNTLSSEIGSPNYDIGHVFSTKVPAGQSSGEGIGLGNVCEFNKGSGSSARSQPVGDAFTVALFSHEIGHQCNGRHTMYHCHNVDQSFSFEPGSGSTIMTYAGICVAGSNIQNFADDYFHSNSAQLIMNYTRSQNCGSEIDFGNTKPDIVLEYPSLLNIPVNTPFYLEGSATDAESPAAALTYCWEQYQIGNRDFEDNPWNITQPIGNEPLFRSRPPVSESRRYFPNLAILVNGTNYIWEQLPSYARDLKFRLTVRDNAAENGGVAWDEVNIRVVDNSVDGLFEITNFNVKDTIKSGDVEEITWEVAGTDNGPINAHFVDIYMSLDGGTSFPVLLKSNTPNDGSALVNIPNEIANRYRFMVVASDNIFFDVTNRSGLLCRDTMTAAVGLTYDDVFFDVCTPDQVLIDINSFGLGGYAGPVDYDFTGTLPQGATANFSSSTAALGEMVILNIDLTNATESGSFNISFMASGNGISSVERTLDLDVTHNDFTALTLNQPADGSTNIGFLPSFEWSLIINADDYTMELSDDPFFSNIVYTAPNITSNQTSVTNILNAGTVYYWRVNPNNNCGSHIANNVASFQVKSLSCDEFCSTSPSVNISSSAPNTIEMEINTGAATTVDEINVTNIDGRHADMSQLKFSLEGPDGSQVVLLENGSCPYNSNMDFGFDDDAVGIFPNCANFNTFNVGTQFQPANPLSILNGQTGTAFKLLVQDVTAGSGGRLDGWCFEICSASNPEAPVLITADSLHVPIMATRVVGVDKLEVSHNQYNASQLTITILQVPTFGSMLFDGSPIASGQQMTMQDILDNRLAYRHESGSSVEDNFTFIATDPGGGFLGTPNIKFFIGPVSTNEPHPKETTLLVFPNPTRDELNVVIESDDLMINAIQIFNIQGKLIQTYRNIDSKSSHIDLSSVPNGMYFVEIRSDEYISMEKIIKQ